MMIEVLSSPSHIFSGHQTPVGMQIQILARRGRLPNDRGSVGIVRALGRILYSSHGGSRLRSCCGVASDRVGQTDENPGTMFTPFVMSVRVEQPFSQFGTGRKLFV